MIIEIDCCEYSLSLFQSLNKSVFTFANFGIDGSLINADTNMQKLLIYLHQAENSERYPPK